MHPAARTGEHESLVPSLPHDCVETVHAPNGKHVGGVAAADEDDVVVKDEVAEGLRRPGEKLESRHGGSALEEVVDAQGSPGVFGHSGIDPQQLRTAVAGEREDVIA